MLRASLVFVGSLFVLSACGGSQPPAEAAPPSGEAPAAGAPETPAPPPTKHFDELTMNEKLEVMKKTVVPTMKPLFQAQDPEKF